MKFIQALGTRGSNPCMPMCVRHATLLVSRMHPSLGTFGSNTSADWAPFVAPVVSRCYVHADGLAVDSGVHSGCPRLCSACCQDAVGCQHMPHCLLCCTGLSRSVHWLASAAAAVVAIWLSFWLLDTGACL